MSLFALASLVAWPLAAPIANPVPTDTATVSTAPDAVFMPMHPATPMLLDQAWWAEPGSLVQHVLPAIVEDTGEVAVHVPAGPGLLIVDDGTALWVLGMLHAAEATWWHGTVDPAASPSRWTFSLLSERRAPESPGAGRPDVPLCGNVPPGPVSGTGATGTTITGAAWSRLCPIGPDPSNPTMFLHELTVYGDVGTTVVVSQAPSGDGVSIVLSYNLTVRLPGVAASAPLSFKPGSLTIHELLSGGSCGASQADVFVMPTSGSSSELKCSSGSLQPPNVTNLVTAPTQV